MGYGDARLPGSLGTPRGGFVLDPDLSPIGSRIAAVGVALPTRVVTSSALEVTLGLEEGWIEGRTGIRERRVADDAASVVTLGAQAAEDALRRACLGAADIDMILVATCTADEILPPVAPRIAHALGADGVAAADVGAACAGSLWALAQADAFIASGSARRVLVVGTEVLSRLTAGSDPRTKVLFGDGAGALVVEATDGGTRLGPFSLHSDGSRPEFLWASHLDRSIRMRGLEVYKRAVEEMAAEAATALAGAGYELKQVDLIIAHQANQRILDAVADRLDVDPAKMYSNIARYGNTSAASIPLALHDARAEGRLRPLDRVLLVSFGAGFVWGAGLIEWSVSATDETIARREVVHAGS